MISRVKIKDGVLHERVWKPWMRNNSWACLEHCNSIISTSNLFLTHQKIIKIWNNVFFFVDAEGASRPTRCQLAAASLHWQCPPQHHGEVPGATRGQDQVRRSELLSNRSRKKAKLGSVIVFEESKRSLEPTRPVIIKVIKTFLKQEQSWNCYF